MSTDTFLNPKVIATLGVPTIVSIFLLLVITGILPTPLMDSLNGWEKVQAQNESITSILAEIRHLERVSCVRDSDTPDKRAECYMNPQ